MPDAAGLSLGIGLGLVVLGYLSGSIPYGLLLTRIAGLGDVRAIGSGNIGATNVLRTGSKAVAALTLLCDVLKGTVPTLIGLKLGGEAGAVIAGGSAFLGHVVPVWLRFKGGKGVATFLGVLFGLAWPLGLAFVVIWLGLAVVFRMSSVSSLAATVAMPLAAYAIGRPGLVGGLALLAALVVIKHRENIARLIRGEESRISLGGKG
jgi:glycerol-3-phosphate acyltransferase PlsY